MGRPRQASALLPRCSGHPCPQRHPAGLWPGLTPCFPAAGSHLLARTQARPASRRREAFPPPGTAIYPSQAAGTKGGSETHTAVSATSWVGGTSGRGSAHSHAAVFSFFLGTVLRLTLSQAKEGRVVTVPPARARPLWTLFWAVLWPAHPTCLRGQEGTSMARFCATLLSFHPRKEASFANCNSFCSVVSTQAILSFSFAPMAGVNRRGSC